MELAKEKRGHFLYRLFCPKGIFYRFVLSQRIVYWIHFQNINPFTYENHYFINVCCLFLKSLKAFSVSLNGRDHTSEQKFYEIYVIEDGKFCNDLTHSEVFFNYFQNTFRTSILKNSSCWLLSKNIKTDEIYC